MSAVLVVHASRHGSTAQVAQRIADRVGEHGWDATVAPARQFRGSVLPYDVVVLGAALYSGRWYAAAHRFLKRHRRELAAKPVAVFAMGPRNDVPESWDRSWEQLKRALAKHDWLRPVAVMVFGGVDPKGKRGAPARDLRDWQAIDAWADEVVGLR